MKKIVCFILLIVVFILLAGYFLNKNNDAVKFKKEYEEYNGKVSVSGKTYPKLDISKNNPIKYKSEEEIIKIIKSGTGVIYFGFPMCPWCRSALPSLFKAAEDAGIKNIYYLNVKDIRDTKKVDESGKIVTEKDGSKGYKDLLKLLDKYLDNYVIEDSKGNKVDTKEKRIFVPLVLFVKNGKIEGMHLDTVDSQKDPYKGLNEKQAEELTLIYYKFMMKIGDDSCDESC